MKKTNPSIYKQYKVNSRERGTTLHETSTENGRKSEADSLEKIQTRMIVSMREKGMSDSEIDRYIAIWVKTLKVWGSKEKPMNWKEATLEYESEKEAHDNNSAE